MASTTARTVAPAKTIQGALPQRLPVVPCLAHKTLFHHPLLGAAMMDTDDGTRGRSLTDEERTAAMNMELTAGRLCRGCPVFDECLKNTLCELRPETRGVGITAGMTARQLRRLHHTLGLPEAPSWSAQSDNVRGLDELAEHRAAFDKVWASLDPRRIRRAWAAIVGRRIGSSNAADTPTQTTEHRRGAAQLALIPANAVAAAPAAKPRKRAASTGKPTDDQQLALLAGDAAPESKDRPRRKRRGRRFALAS